MWYCGFHCYNPIVSHISYAQCPLSSCKYMVYLIKCLTIWQDPKYVCVFLYGGIMWC